LSYLSAVASGYLAITAPLFHTGPAALAALGTSGGLGIVSAALLAIDAVLGRRRPSRPPPRIAAV
jgi:hypothetical protein